MYQVQPVPLSAEQIGRIQTAARIIDHDRRWRQLVSTTAIAYVKGMMDFATLRRQVNEYMAFQQRNPRLPI